MANSKKPRKSYRPKGVITNPMDYLLSGLAKPDEDIKLNLRVKFHLAMANITQGNGRPEDWAMVADAINVCIVLSEMDFGREFYQDLVDAQQAMLDLKERYRRTGRLVPTGDEMQAINVALDLHDQQIDLVRTIDVERAVFTVQKRLAAGIVFRGNKQLEAA